MILGGTHWKGTILYNFKELHMKACEVPPENAWRLFLCLFLACFFVDSGCGSIMNHQLEGLFVCLNVIVYI